ATRHGRSGDARVADSWWPPTCYYVEREHGPATGRAGRRAVSRDRPAGRGRVRGRVPRGAGRRRRALGDEDPQGERRREPRALEARGDRALDARPPERR